MEVNIDALDLLWMALAVIAYATGATSWAYLAVPQERRTPRVPVSPANAYFDPVPVEDIPSSRAHLAK
ncbi:MAG: hypothetical protein H7234_05740 [Herminiimonas sp.]|nr:hypothetical protein [Herminiimonas sp.]